MQLDLSPQPVPLAYDAHGTVRVAGTRVTLDSIIAAFKQDQSPDALASGFPTLGLANIYAVIAYYFAHQSEVEAYLEQRKREADTLWRFIDTETDRAAWRDRLVARHVEREHSKPKRAT